MPTTYLHVNKQIIARNARHGTDDPPVRIQRGKSGKSTYCNEVEILDDRGKVVCRLIYSAHEPILRCGARLVIVTENEVRVAR